MRLVDADNIIKILNTFIENTNDIETYKDYNYSYRRCKKLILDEPTAYDIDNVEELKAINEMDLEIPQHFTKEQSEWIKAYCIKRNKEFYNKAIEDFVNYANTMPTIEDEDDGYIRPMHLEEMAEKLKI